MSEPKCILLYLDDIDVMGQLSYEERGRLITALLRYAKDGTEEELAGNERFLFPMFKLRIDREFEKYQATCERNRKNIEKRWQKSDTNDTTGMGGIRPNTTVYEDVPKIPNQSQSQDQIKSLSRSQDQDQGQKQCIGDKPPRTPAFRPPTLEEVTAYCKQRGKGVDPQRWMNHYTANGWMVGRTKMKDWKAAVRTWERSETGGNVFMQMLEEEQR